MHFKVELISILVVISNLQFNYSRGVRFGGIFRVFRGGVSSYKGGIRIGGFRGKSLGNIRTSAFSSWSGNHGLSSSFRYRSSLYLVKRRHILMGFIIVSNRTRSKFDLDKESSFNDISICYNEFSLYDRNLSQSPWFVCPWDDMSYRYCCGDEIEEKCCRYFDRPGHLAGLIIGFLIVFVFLMVTCYCCCKHPKGKPKSEQKLIFYNTNQELIEEEHDELTSPINIQYPPYQTNEAAPRYPTSTAPGDDYKSNIMLQNMYGPPSKLGIKTHYSDVQTLQQISHIGYYNHSFMQHPLNAFENPPPSYQDNIKNPSV